MKKTRLAAGALLIAGAVLVNVPYAVLIASFGYPDVLRAPAGEILSRFAAGGPPLIWAWLCFAWAGLPILFGILLLPHVLRAESPSDTGRISGGLAVFFGAAGAMAQILGLLRWAFVVPGLARLYADPQSSASTREAALVVFQAVHSYGGIALGEHIGQIFTIIWTVLVSFSFLRARLLFRWLAFSGFGVACVYFLAQGELISTAIPGFPSWGAAGLIGSLLWIAWLIALGANLLLAGRKHLR